MNQHPDIQVDLSLIGRYLAGEASPEEALIVDRWRELTAENNATFESVARLWDLASPAAAGRVPDDRTEWRKLQAAMGMSSRKMPGSMFTFRRVAAGLLVLLGAAILGYLLLPRTVPSEFGKVVSSGADVVRDTLQDMSLVTLAPQSTLSVNRQFATAGRKIRLDGEGYFSVEPLPGQPFIIYTGGIKIMVLGTILNVENGPASVTVGVSSGIVKMYGDSAGILVPAGSTGVYNKQEDAFYLYRDSLNRNTGSYATGALYFYNMPLGKVKDVLERTYRVRVLFEDPELARYRINTQFNRQPLQYVLDVISATLGIQYRMKGKTVYFFGNESR